MLLLSLLVAQIDPLTGIRFCPAGFVGVLAFVDVLAMSQVKGDLTGLPLGSF